MKRIKKLTRKQRNMANKLAREQAAQLPRKVTKIKPMFSLPRYLHVNAQKKHAKKHFREHKRAEKAEASK